MELRHYHYYRELAPAMQRVRLQMDWDNLRFFGTKALALLWLEFRRLSRDVAIVVV